MAVADDHSWTAWGGGAHCPVPVHARVFLVYRDGTESKVRIAGFLRWAHENLCDDIMHYRLRDADHG